MANHGSQAFQAPVLWGVVFCGFVSLSVPMGVAELLKWRAPPLIILVWILLCYNKAVCQNEAML